MSWWQTFFDADYARLWSAAGSDKHDRQQVDGLWQILRGKRGMRVLDAPCGYGRLSRLLAARGAQVLGVDQSQALLAVAESQRSSIDSEHLRYQLHDLRQPLAESGFDAALNIYTSLGYGNQDDDRAIIRTLHDAVRPGGLVFVETLHRDAALAAFAKFGASQEHELADGTIMREEPTYRAEVQRIDTTWSWRGPRGEGERHSSLRIYTPDELRALLVSVGLRAVDEFAGCTPAPFESGSGKLSSRIGLLYAR